MNLNALTTSSDVIAASATAARLQVAIARIFNCIIAAQLRGREV